MSKVTTKYPGKISASSDDRWEHLNSAYNNADHENLWTGGDYWVIAD